MMFPLPSQNASQRGSWEYPRVPDVGFFSGVFDGSLDCRQKRKHCLSFSSDNDVALQCIQAYFPRPIYENAHRSNIVLAHPLERYAICAQVKTKVHPHVVHAELQVDLTTFRNVSIPIVDVQVDQVAYMTGLACAMGFEDRDLLRDALQKRWSDTVCSNLPWDVCPQTLDWSAHTETCLKGQERTLDSLSDRFRRMSRIYKANNMRQCTITQTHHRVLHEFAQRQPILLRQGKPEMLTHLPYSVVKRWVDVHGVHYITSRSGLTHMERLCMEDMIRKGSRPKKVWEALIRKFPSMVSKERNISLTELRDKIRYYKRKQDVEL
jgi:hypothetical protein